MSNKYLVDQMIQIREEMQNLNSRIQSASTKRSIPQQIEIPYVNLEHKSQLHDKIKKGLHRLISFDNQYFKRYLISEQYTWELLKSNNIEQLLLSTIKILCKLLKNQQKRIALQLPSPQPSSIGSTKLHKLIKEIVTPFNYNVMQQAQSLSQSQLQQSINKSCQTVDQTSTIPKRQNFEYQQEPFVSSPKFSSDSPPNRLTFKNEEIVETPTEPPKIETNQIQINFNTLREKVQNSSILSIKEKHDHSSTSMLEQKKPSKYNFAYASNCLSSKRFPSKDIPKQMLSVDYIEKKRRTPEKQRNFNIITNI